MTERQVKIQTMEFFLSFFPFLIILFVLYFLLIRPQAKEEKRRLEFIRNLKKGEIVVLSSGFIGKVVDVDERTVTLELSKDVKVKVVKNAIQGRWQEKPQTQQKK